MVVALMPPRRRVTETPTRGFNLAALRDRAGLTQQQLGDKLGISYKTVSAYENNRAVIRSTEFGKWAEALGISQTEFETSLGFGVPASATGIRREAAAIVGPDDAELVEETVETTRDWPADERRHALEVAHRIVMNWRSTGRGRDGNRAET